MTIMETIATTFAILACVYFVIGSVNGIIDELRKRGYEVRFPTDILAEVSSVWREILGGYILAAVLYAERRCGREGY